MRCSIMDGKMFVWGWDLHREVCRIGVYQGTEERPSVWEWGDNVDRDVGMDMSMAT